MEIEAPFSMEWRISRFEWNEGNLFSRWRRWNRPRMIISPESGRSNEPKAGFPFSASPGRKYYAGAFIYAGPSSPSFRFLFFRLRGSRRAERRAEISVASADSRGSGWDGINELIFNPCAYSERQRTCSSTMAAG